MGAEQGEGIVQIALGIDGDDWRAHEAVDTGIVGKVAGHSPTHQVTVGDHPHQILPVDDRQRSQAGTLHDRGRFSN